jgi:hypothetical protein
MEKKKYKYSDFGRLLRRQRKMKFGDIKSFFNATGIPLKDLYEYESGRVFPPIEKFVTICKRLDKSATYMLSPILELTHIEHEIMNTFEDADVKEILEDEELANMLKSPYSVIKFCIKRKNILILKGRSSIT